MQDEKACEKKCVDSFLWSVNVYTWQFDSIKKGNEISATIFGDDVDVYDKSIK